MSALNIYYDDLDIAKSIINREDDITREFIYIQCYPLFKSIYNNYYTDCKSVIEFINEIYLLILTKSNKTNQCKLENYRGESSLATWLKTISLFYCYHKYKRKTIVSIIDTVSSDDLEKLTDRLLSNTSSTYIDSDSLDCNDLMTILNMMPNERYRTIIKLRYIEHKTNEETAAILNLSMANYYNKHKLAKEQFICVLNKEESNG